VITSLFPHLYTVFTAEGVHSKHVRARACTVMYKCIKLMSLLGGASASEEVSLRLLERCAPQWLECFATTIAAPLPHDDAGELCMRIEMVRILTVLISVYPLLLSSCMAQLIHALWHALATTVEVYEHLIVHGRGPVELDIDPADDVDGDRIAIDTLAWELMECVRAVVSCTRASKLVRAELRPLAFAQIRFMQVTQEQLESWAVDVNAYIAHEDEGSFETSVRILAAEVVSDMCETFEEEGWEAVLAAVMGHLEGAEQERQAGREKWWLRREASMFAVTAICADVDELEGLAHLFSPLRFVREVVLPNAASDAPPVLRARALHCLSAFAAHLDTEHAAAAFEAAALSLSEKAPLPVRMSATRAIG
jgi:importin-9